jgi:hypothetical protein
VSLLFFLLDVAPFLFLLNLPSSKRLLVSSLMQILLRISGSFELISSMDPFFYNSIILNEMIQESQISRIPFVEFPMHFDESLVISMELSSDKFDCLLDCAK